jgi:hypothetical protein
VRTARLRRMRSRRVPPGGHGDINVPRAGFIRRYSISTFGSRPCSRSGSRVAVRPPAPDSPDLVVSSSSVPVASGRRAGRAPRMPKRQCTDGPPRRAARVCSRRRTAA